MAVQTSSVGSLARRAPVGQRLMHCPQAMLVQESGDHRPVAPSNRFEHADFLQIDTGADAAPAQDALVQVADHGVARAIHRERCLGRVAEAEEVDTVLLCQRLQLAVVVAAARVALAVVP